jgi:hypothetical protein
MATFLSQFSIGQQLPAFYNRIPQSLSTISSLLNTMATVSDTTNDPQPPQAGFQPEAETTIGTTFQMSGFQPSAQATTSTSYVRTGTPPQIDIASSLPGAFFFLTLTLINDTKARVVAYDPWVQNGNSATSIQDYYKQNLPNSLPYYEIFSKDAANPWNYGKEYYCEYYSSTTYLVSIILAVTRTSAFVEISLTDWVDQPVHMPKTPRAKGY